MLNIKILRLGVRIKIVLFFLDYFVATFCLEVDSWIGVLMVMFSEALTEGSRPMPIFRSFVLIGRL